MYQIGDLIVYGSTGVCVVDDIKMPNSKIVKKGIDNTKFYYVLRSLYHSGTIYTPVDNDKVFMRPIISSDEVNRIIDMIPFMKTSTYQPKNTTDLKEHYNSTFQSHNCSDLVELTMSIYAKKKTATAQKRRLGQVDEQYMRKAEDLLHGEFAAALGIEKETVSNYISDRVGE